MPNKVIKSYGDKKVGDNDLVRYSEAAAYTAWRVRWASAEFFVFGLFIGAVCGAVIVKII